MERKTNDGLFIRWYIDAAKSGLLADMGAERWHTLCALATFMNAQGECWPSQKTLAERMGVARETANRRVKQLAAYRWRGQPVIAVEKRGTGEHERNVYRLLPASGLRLFEAEAAGGTEETEEDTKEAAANTEQMRVVGAGTMTREQLRDWL